VWKILKLSQKDNEFAIATNSGLFIIKLIEDYYFEELYWCEGNIEDLIELKPTLLLASF